MGSGSQNEKPAHYRKVVGGCKEPGDPVQGQVAQLIPQGRPRLARVSVVDPVQNGPDSQPGQVADVLRPVLGQEPGRAARQAGNQPQHEQQPAHASGT